MAVRVTSGLVSSDLFRRSVSEPDRFFSAARSISTSLFCCAKGGSSIGFASRLSCRRLTHERGRDEVLATSEGGRLRVFGPGHRESASSVEKILLGSVFENQVGQLLRAERFVHHGDQLVASLKAIAIEFQPFGGAENRRGGGHLLVAGHPFKKFQTGADWHLVIGHQEVDPALANSLVGGHAVTDRLHRHSGSGNREAHHAAKDRIIFGYQNGGGTMGHDPRCQ